MVFKGICSSTQFLVIAGDVVGFRCGKGRGKLGVKVSEMDRVD